MINKLICAPLIALFAMPLAQSDQITTGAPTIATGHTSSQIDYIAQPGTPLTSFSGFVRIALDMPQPSGYELTALTIYLGGYLHDTLGNIIESGWHGTIDGVPFSVASGTLSPFTVPLDIADPGYITIASDLPDAFGNVGVIEFGRSAGDPMRLEDDCTASIVLPPFDCQTRDTPYALAYTAVFTSTVDEPSALLSLVLVIAIVIGLRMWRP